MFQFTPLREGRRMYAPCLKRGQSFNSRPCVRGDVRDTRRGKLSTLFQFTPLREGRRYKPSGVTACLVFQFTPLREGRPPAP